MNLENTLSASTSALYLKRGLDVGEFLEKMLLIAIFILIFTLMEDK